MALPLALNVSKHWVKLVDAATERKKGDKKSSNLSLPGSLHIDEGDEERKAGEEWEEHTTPTATLVGSSVSGTPM